MTAAERFVKRMLVPETVSPENESGDAVKHIDGEARDVTQRQTALEVALNYLENEGNEIQRNPFSKGWAIKDGYGKDGLSRRGME